MAISRDQIERWGNAPSEREETKCQNTVERIKKAIRGHFGNDVYIYLQGSYRNRTNVRTESDVDVVVEHPNYYFPGLFSLTEAERAKYNASFVPANYPFERFKSDVLILMQNEFGFASVTRKNKCIRIEKDAYRVNADVVPCFTFKRFSTATAVEAEGIAFKADDNGVIDSFPKQHYENGASKNLSTGERYKGVVRVLKNVRNSLLDARSISEDLMPSFFLESLVWNVPNPDFNHQNLYDAARQIIFRVWDDMAKPDKSSNYAEVSDLKWLLKGADAPNKIQNARSFMETAWKFIGYA